MTFSFTRSLLFVGVVALTVPLFASAQAVSGGCGTGLDGVLPPGCESPLVTTDAADAAATEDAQAQAAAFSRRGVFGCSVNGSYSMSVGAMGAIGGVYVPVNDAAVTLNTGYIVYKECVLRGVVNREREAATAQAQRGVIGTYQRGRNGKPFYPEVLSRDLRDERDRVVALSINNGALSTLKPELQNPVTRAILQGYVRSRKLASPNYSCSYTGDLKNLYSGNPSGSIWAGLSAIGDPGCNPIIAYEIANEYYMSIAASATDELLMRLGWADGTYDNAELDENGNWVTRTPGSIVQANVIQMLQTGYKQLENANDIDQMVGSLFSGITSQILSDSKGLLGLVQRSGNQPSYLDKVVTETQQSLRSTAVNAALQILVAARQVEVSYKTILQNIVGIISNTTATLQSRENACWALIIDKVCVAAPGADKKCTQKVVCTETTGGAGAGGGTDTTTNCPTGATLTVATSTAFSQAVISTQLSPLAASASTTLANSNTVITTIDGLIAALTNTSSPEGQLAAMRNVDVLVTPPSILHTQNDIATAQGALQDVTTRAGNVVTDTTAAWADSTDTKTGWCNVNRKEVADAWGECWKQGSTSCLWK